MKKIKKFKIEMKYWMKYGIVLSIINFILVLIGIDCISKTSGWAFRCLPWFYSSFPFVWYNFDFPLVVILSTFTWFLIGSLIGHIIGKVKEK